MTNAAKEVFIGLDLECSGSDVQAHELIQIGIATSVSCSPVDMFVSDVGWDEYLFQTKALEVNRFTHKRIRSGPDRWKVEMRLYDWLVSKGFKQNHALVPVGFNVAGFDMPFVRKTWPQLTNFFSYRSVDLNAVCFTMAQAGLKVNGRTPTWKEWKRYAKTHAENRLAETMPDREAHDALYDAVAALHTWYWLRDAMAGRPVSIT